MIYAIIWTPRAQVTFNANIEYLNNEWDQAVLNDFFDRVDEVIATIRLTPLLFPIYKIRGEIRRCVVTEQISLYYRIVNESTIDLLPSGMFTRIRKG